MNRIVSKSLLVVVLISLLSSNALAASSEWEYVGEQPVVSQDVYTESIHVSNGIPYLITWNRNPTASVYKYDGSDWVDLNMYASNTYPNIYNTFDVYNGHPYLVNSTASTRGSDYVLTIQLVQHDGDYVVNVGNTLEFVEPSLAEYNAKGRGIAQFHIENGIPYMMIGETLDATASPAIIQYTVYTLQSGTWQELTHFESAGGSFFSDMDVDDGNIYFAYRRIVGHPVSKVTVMMYDGSTWHNLTDSMDVSTTSNSDMSVIVSQGLPYVCYQSADDNNNVIVSRYVDENWEMVGGSAAAIGSTTNQSEQNDYSMEAHLAIYRSVPYVSYTNINDGNRITVNQLDGGTWQTVTRAGMPSGPTRKSSISISQGSIYITFEIEQAPNVYYPYAMRLPYRVDNPKTGYR